MMGNVNVTSASGAVSASSPRSTGHGDRLVRGGAGIGMVGLVLWVVGVLIEPRQALTSYLFAYASVVTVIVGALIQVMISHVTGAHWFTVLRRLTTDLTGAMPALGVLALPILFGAPILYSWATPEALSVHARDLVLRKQAWLNVPFFIVRGAVYVTVWLASSEVLRRWSLAQDHTTGDDTVVLTRRQRRISAVALVAVGLTLTFAAFDWLMSLEPTWYSSIYGAYVFAGGFLAALGVIAVIAYVESRPGMPLDGSVTPEHFGALGKLLLTFVMFWGYIAFSQYFIIWIGDMPADVSWYVWRTSGSWGTLALVVAIGQFAIPFVLLLPRAPKRRPRLLAAIGAWLILMHLLDVYWLVLPALRPTAVHVSWLDFTSLLMIGGFTTATARWRARSHTAIPVADPYLPIALAYREP